MIKDRMEINNVGNSVITDFQYQLLQSENIREIYGLIPSVIRKLIGHGLVITTLLDPEEDTLQIANYNGLNTSMDKLIDIIGNDPRKLKFDLKDIQEDELAIYRSGKLELLEGGIYALATRKIPKFICTAIEKLLKIKYVFTMGIIYNGDHYGGLIILTDQNVFPQKDIIELLINQAAIITQRILVEEELKVAKHKAEESDRFKSAFLANMSHEIRTPLNSIIGFASFLKDRDKSREEMDVYADIITTSGDHLLNLINDIIDISKIDAGQVKLSFSEVDINSLMMELYSFFSVDLRTKRKTNVELQVLPGEEQLRVITDETRIKQILINLIGNAVKFTDQGQISFGYQVEKNMIHFFVKDTGIGIPSATQEIIFERFRQGTHTESKNVGGTGLGLAIAKACTNLLKGEIWLESETGTGSNFHFTVLLNRISQTSEINHNNENHEHFHFENKTILVAEDEDSNYLLIQTMLQGAGINVLRAINGQEAIDQALNNDDIQLILMDIKMPVMTGLEASIEIKKVKPDLPIIAQTAYAFNNDKEKFISAGCDDYISKPITQEILLKKLVRYLQTNK